MPTCGLPDINLRSSRAKMTPQTSNMAPNRPYFRCFGGQMAPMSLFVDLTDTATQRDPAPTYVISAGVLKTLLATVLRPVAPLRSPEATPHGRRACGLSLCGAVGWCPSLFSFSFSFSFSMTMFFEIPTWSAGMRGRLRM